MTNQIAVNNNMIKTIIENSNLGNANQNNGFVKEYDIFNINFFPGKIGEKINIIFYQDSLTQITIVVPSDATVEELLQAFYVKLQIYGKINNKNIYELNHYFFIRNGNMISLNEKRTIHQFGLVRVFEKIIFKNRNDLIGG